jgi:hypothetical protein
MRGAAAHDTHVEAAGGLSTEVTLGDENVELDGAS